MSSNTFVTLNILVPSINSPVKPFESEMIIFQFIVSLIPATFMTSVCVSYILQAPEGFRLNAMFSNGVGIVASIVLFMLFILNRDKLSKKEIIKG